MIVILNSLGGENAIDLLDSLLSDPQADILTRKRSQGPHREAQRAVFAPSDVVFQFGFRDGMSEQSNDATLTGSSHLVGKLAHTVLAFGQFELGYRHSLKLTEWTSTSPRPTFLTLLTCRTTLDSWISLP